MGKIIRVLVVDDDIEQCKILKEHMNSCEDINFLGIAKDGLIAIEMIKLLLPDVVLLDLIMPNLDGIGVLERLSSLSMEHKPLVIIFSAIGQDTLIQKAISLGAKYYIIKPFNISTLILRVRQIYQGFQARSVYLKENITVSGKKEPATIKQAPNIENKVTGLMLKAGLMPHVSGFQYIREAVIQSITTDSKVFGPITKTIYPEVANKFDTTPQKVERSIRSAIESAWLRVNKNPGYYDDFKIWIRAKKPSNSELIAFLVDKVRINLEKGDILRNKKT